MRILFVYTHTIHGGGETYLLRIIDGIDKTEFEPFVAISKRNVRLAKDLETRRIPYVALPDMNLLWKNKVAKALVQLPNFIMMNCAIGWLILKERIRVVHAGMFYSALFSVIPAKVLGRRFLWTALTEPDIVRYPALTNLLLRLSDRTVSVCKYFVNLARSENAPCIEKMQVIYTGLTDDRFLTRKPAGELNVNGYDIPRYIVALIARFDESQKGHRYFWEMAARVHKAVPKANFVVAGAPADDAGEDFRKRLIKMADEFGIAKNLFLIGHIKDIPEFLSGIDILILPSTHEGAPVVVQEAAAAGKPVVAFPAGGTGELMKDGETGFVVPMKDAGALADRVIALLSDQKMMRAMGENGKRFAEERFREGPFIRTYERLYTSLASR